MSEIIKIAPAKSSFTYYVNCDKGVVVAVMNNPKDEILKEIDGLYEDAKFFSYLNTVLLLVEDTVPEKVCAKATCKENDEFDVEVGMQIAKEKCLFKFLKYKIRTLCKISDDIDEFCDKLEDKIISEVVRQTNYGNKIKSYTDCEVEVANETEVLENEVEVEE